MIARITLATLLSLNLLGTLARAADETAKASEAELRFFESKIRPVLAENCYACHSGSAGKAKGGLMLDTRAAIRQGGDNGPAVVPGDPDASLLVAAISHIEPDLTMPPRKPKLPDPVIDDFKTWIKRGAADPREPKVTAGAEPGSGPTISIEEGRKFWSYQPPKDHTPPITKNARWARRGLDQFILARLEAEGLAPSADAETATLLRRLHFDLVGLPPSPEAIEQFETLVESRGIDSALAVEVDRLLASQQFGERWGRHWLDVARFAESSGKEANVSFPYAWRYRDYVIDAFNADLSFDQFLKEQVAGDLLPAQNDEERARLLIATGFLAVGTKNLDESNAVQFKADLVDEQIDALSRGVLANSIACARCHDHKLDPYPMEDYYALAGIFASTKTYFGTFVSPSNQVGGDPLILPRGAGLPILHASITPEKVKSLKADLAALKKEKIKTIGDALRVFWRSGGIEGELERVDEEGKALPLAMGVMDDRRILDAHLLERGEITKPGKAVSRGFPQVVTVENCPSPPSDQSGRLELAQWLTSPSNPLTARVMTNRIWRHLLGAGIVKSVDNFGMSGDRPSHPELLDHLTTQFVSRGWSVKSLIREIVLSRTYRQASTYREEAFRADPDNRLLWRASKRRIDAEAIRDAMLAVSGDLDLSRRVGSLVGKEIGDRPISLLILDTKLPGDLDGSTHRSVYLPVLRERLPDILDLFDFAEPSLVTGDRETTNVPVQALYLLNSPFVATRARSFAARLEHGANDLRSQVERAFALCFGRAPTSGELKASKEFLEHTLNEGSTGDQKGESRLAALCHSLLSTAEFRNLD